MKSVYPFVIFVLVVSNAILSFANHKCRREIESLKLKYEFARDGCNWRTDRLNQVNKILSEQLGKESK